MPTLLTFAVSPLGWSQSSSAMRTAAATLDVGHLELTFQSLDLPLSGRAGHNLVSYTAEPGSASEDRLELLAIWAATQSRAEQPTRHSAQPLPATPPGRRVS